MESFETGKQDDCKDAVAVGIATGSNHPAMSSTAGGTGAAPDSRLCHGNWNSQDWARTRSPWPGRVGCWELDTRPIGALLE